MNRFLAALAFACALSSSALAVADSDGTRPDPKLTPGRAATQDLDIICHHKTSERRHTTAAEKNGVYRLYGLKTHKSGWCAGNVGCAVDHVIPLECGGADVVDNLFPQKGAGPYNQKDKNRLEGLCKRLVCSGEITPAEGQAWFMPDWTVEYDRRFGPISRDR
jgi:hypothetical protein